MAKFAFQNLFHINNYQALWTKKPVTSISSSHTFTSSQEDTEQACTFIVIDNEYSAI